MPFAAQSPPPPAAHAAAESAQDALVDSLRAMAGTSPQLVIDRLGEVTSSHERDRLRKTAFLSAAASQPELASMLLPDVIGADWIGQIAFRDAWRLAKLAQAGDSQALMESVATRQPELAIREWELYDSLPFSRDIFSTAATLAPDAAVAVASGNSPSATAIREKLASHPLERVLSVDVPAPVRARLAWFASFVDSGEMTMEGAIAAAASNYSAFRELAERREEADRKLIPTLDRALARVATDICQAFQQSPASGAPLATWEPREIYLLLAYSMPQDEDKYFAPIFDRYFAPRARGLLQVAARPEAVRLASFLEQALGAQRLDSFLNLAGSDAAAAALVAGLLDGDVDAAFVLADVIENMSGSSRLRALDRLLAQRAGNSEVFAALRARLSARLGPNKNPSASFPVNSLFNKDGVSLQRHFFYDDSDGVESFDSFRAAYANSANWKWENHDGWVLLAGRRGGRQIRIVANVPLDLLSPPNSTSHAEVAGRRRAVSEYVAASGLPVSVIVHRGHSYHVDLTIDALPRSARLVFLGSCRGMSRMREVAERSPRAAVIATRATGTAKVNDTLLKALNEALLRHSPIDWPVFWKSQQSRFNGNGDFSSYISPHRNAAVEFARELERASQARMSVTTRP